MHRIIYDELVVGKVRGHSKEQYLNIIQAMVNQGVEAVILGCTEIMLLIQEQDAQIPLFDTTRIHAEAAVEYALIHYVEVVHLRQAKLDIKHIAGSWRRVGSFWERLFGNVPFYRVRHLSNSLL